MAGDIVGDVLRRGSPSTPYAPGVDVIVVNHRTPHDLRLFLDSLRPSVTENDMTVWIVNTAPEPTDKRVAAAFKGAHKINFQDNVGYNRAVNRVAEHGRHAHVAVFNADVVLTPNSIDVMIGALAEHDDWAIVGPRQVDDNNRITAPGIVGTNDAPDWRGGWRQPGHKTKWSDVRDDIVVVLGSAFVVRRRAWDQLTRCPTFQHVAPEAPGPMLPTFGYYGETWLSYHARAHGWKLGYLGTTTVTHRWHRASKMGGAHERMRPVDQAYFRDACASHGIECD